MILLKSQEETIRVDYIDGNFVFSDEEKAERIMAFDGFLFQKLTINQSFLSSLSMKSKSYNGNNGRSILIILFKIKLSISIFTKMKESRQF